MKKYLLFTILFSLVLLPSVSASPDFSHPVLKKAQEQLYFKIDQKTKKILLDENSKKTINQKKENLSNILLSIDASWKKRDKIALKEQAKLFRDSYKETVRFIQDIEKTGISSTV